MTTEGQVRHAFPAFKVYIFGVDVTEDVLQIDVKNHLGKSPNICTVTLANDLDKYIYTTQDMITLYGPKVQAAAAAKVAALKEAQSASSWAWVRSLTNDQNNYNTLISDESFKQLEYIYPLVKRLVLMSKIDVLLPDIVQPDVAGENENARQLTGNAFRYPFQAEDPIFHANDPIRVFFRDPFNPSKWYHGFTGFLSDFDDAVDENNVRILTVTAEGPSKVLRYARITTNPGIVDVSAIVMEETDASERSFWTEGFYDITLPEYMFALVFGSDPSGEYGGKFSIKNVSADGHHNSSQIRLRGAGQFNYARSTVVEFGPSESCRLDISDTPITTVSSLAQYQSIIDHELKESDLYTMLVESITDKSEIDNYLKNAPRFSDGAIDPNAIMNYLGTRTDLYPADGGALIMLIPKSFHPSTNRNVLMKELIQSPAMTTTFRNRLGMIYDTIERIEFVFYESPKGDLICEFPLYDFSPDDFGYNEVPKSRVAGESTSSDRKIEDDPTIKSGPFANKWIITKRDTFNFSKSVTDEKVRTQLACAYGFVPGFRSATGTSDGILIPMTVTLKHLASLYGYRVEQADPKGHITSPKAALAYAHITLNKMNSDARSLGINALPNLGAWLNRPIYFLPRNCIGTLTGVTHTIKWGMSGGMDTRLNMNYIRGWDGLINSKTGEPVFTTIGGLPGRPLNYKLLFGLEDDVLEGNTTPPSPTLGAGRAGLVEKP
jgi:hypothetical protein